MNNENQKHFTLNKENEGSVDLYFLAPGIGICFNQIYTNSWTKGDSSVFSGQMLILNFCLKGRCDVSLAGNRYAIVGERQICVSTILPTKDFYYPGRLYEGIQIYVDRCAIEKLKGKDLLTEMGIHAEQIAIVKEAETLIMEDLSKRITAKEMAERFGISESSFKLYVRGILGDSYLSYFRKKRMERAAELLESTNLKVIEIANAVGYENQGKFAKVFAEMYGVQPLEFRRLSK